MRHNKRRTAGVLATILLAFSLVIAGCGDDESKEADNSQDVTAELGQPLDTTSKKVVAEYQGGKVTEGEIIEWSRGQMAAYKCPRQVEFVDQLPMTASGKILWRALQEKEWEKAKKESNDRS